mmetsp:Transcript_124057/g.312362  ORF Transcript_124057/g.312362 Transcript_124057/m.312362 type:complete len:228 (-) Transcript_124057:295-978(-)
MTLPRIGISETSSRGLGPGALPPPLPLQPPLPQLQPLPQPPVAQPHPLAQPPPLSQPPPLPQLQPPGEAPLNSPDGKANIVCWPPGPAPLPLPVFAFFAAGAESISSANVGSCRRASKVYVAALSSASLRFEAASPAHARPAHSAGRPGMAIVHWKPNAVWVLLLFTSSFVTGRFKIFISAVFSKHLLFMLGSATAMVPASTETEAEAFLFLLFLETVTGKLATSSA